jgi:hypothetical protein
MKKLAIVGSHPATRELAPYDNPEYDILVFNEAASAPWCKRWDIVTQLHKVEVYSCVTNWVDKGHWDWLQTDHGNGKTIYLQGYDARVPNSARYPLDEIIASIPGASLRWMMSSAAYALALGLYLGYEEIGIWGVELTSNTEYSYQFPNWAFWLGVAMGTGVKIDVQSGQVHFSERMYGYEGETQIPRQHFVDRYTALGDGWKRAEWDLKKVKNELMDALQKAQHDKILGLIVKVREIATSCGEIAGARAEAENYATREDPISRQEFERRSAQAQQEGEGHGAAMYHAGGKAEYVLNAWRDSGKYEALRQLRLFLGEQAEQAYHLGAKLGIHRENKDYMIEFDNRLTAAGGVRTLAAMNGVTES